MSDLLSKQTRDNLLSLLKDLFVANIKDIKLENGIGNLLSIRKEFYARKIEKDFEAELQKIENQDEAFKVEVLEKVINFFSQYISEETGVIFFNNDKNKNVKYGELFTENTDVKLFWKTDGLYYVKSERYFDDFEMTTLEGNRILFATEDIKNASSKKQKSSDLLFKFLKSENDIITINVMPGKMSIKAFDELNKQSGLSENELKQAFQTFKKQSNYDYFINKDVDKFLNGQLDMYLYDYVFKDLNVEDQFSTKRLEQIKFLKDISSLLIVKIAEFESELVKIWQKPKFVFNTNYVISLDKIINLSSISYVQSIITDTQKEYWNTNGIEFTLDEITEDSKQPLDTKFLSQDKKQELLKILENINELSDGLLIKSDNWQALNNLKTQYTGKIKLCYIDPPYNTGGDSFIYKDKFKRSTWLAFMKNRLEIARDLLSDDGVIFVQCDDNEQAYLKVLMDETFGTHNFITTITVKSSTPSGTKTAHKDKTIIKQKDSIIMFKKSSNIKIKPQYSVRTSWDKHYTKWLYKDNNEYKLKNLLEVLLSEGIINDDTKIKTLDINNVKFKKFYLDNKNNIIRLQSHKNDDMKKLSKLNVDTVIADMDKKETKGLYYNGQVITPLSQGIKEVLTPKGLKQELSMLVCDFWDDIDFQNTQNQGGVSLTSGKKPEQLMYRIIDMITNTNDIVLDFFAGSGTTGAVAHKMGRKWITIEQMDYIEDITKKRLVSVVNGEQGGISKALNWHGGGMFKYYELESYENVLSKMAMGTSLFTPIQDQRETGFYIFDKKYSDVVKIDDEFAIKNDTLEHSKALKLSLDELYTDKQIDLAETIANIKGSAIKTINTTEFTLCNGETYKLEPQTEEEISTIIRILKPAIYW